MHPPISLLKPVKGVDVEAAANFRSFCRQDYPDYEVLFGALDPEDPALAIAQEVAEEAESPPVRVIASARRHGANLKVSNLINLMVHARHDLIVVTDSDMRVGPDYLGAVAEPFRDPSVGLVTCPYRAARVEGPVALLEALAIATEFIPSVMVAERLGGMRFAFGATLAVRRQTLEAIGGLEVLADHLADDYELGRRVRAAGWKVVLAPYIVETVLGRERLSAMWLRRLRWARTVRVCRPAGYRGSFITHTAPLAFLALAAARTSNERAAATAGLLVRGVAAWGAAKALGAPLGLSRLLMLPLSDLVSAVLWIGGLAGRRVTWRGERYRLREDGRLEPACALESPREKMRTYASVQRPNPQGVAGDLPPGR